MSKCAANIKAGFHPILLVPGHQVARARVHAQDAKVDQELTILSIEDFVALNIIEMAAAEGRDFYGILSDIIKLYNQRLAEVETDLSLTIQLR